MLDHDQQPEGWVFYQKLVLKELERHSASLEAINSKIETLQVEIAMLKVKAGVWGLVGGVIPVFIAIFVQQFGSGK